MALRQVLDKVFEQAMRKRSAYRPRRVLLNPVGFVLEGLCPVRAHTSFALDLKIKNHGALASLMQGKGTRTDIDALIAMVNITEALCRLGFGTDYSAIVRDALAGVRSLGRRYTETGSSTMRAEEIKAINAVMELHDEQMDVIVLNDMDNAIALVQKEFALGRMTPIT